MKRWICASACLCVVASAGCSKLDNQDKTPGVSPSQSSVAQPSAPQPSAHPDQAVIYVVNPKAATNDDPLMARTVSLSQPLSPARSALDALLHDPNSPFPPGTALRGITITDGLATLDFSRSPVNETGGEGGQGNALTAIGRTLGQFPEIQRFQIEVKGSLVKAFGEFTTDGPMDVTRPEAKS